MPPGCGADCRPAAPPGEAPLSNPRPASSSGSSVRGKPPSFSRRISVSLSLECPPSLAQPDRTRRNAKRVPRHVPASQDENLPANRRCADPAGGLPRGRRADSGTRACPRTCRRPGARCLQALDRCKHVDVDPGHVLVVALAGTHRRRAVAHLLVEGLHAPRPWPAKRGQGANGVEHGPAPAPAARTAVAADPQVIDGQRTAPRSQIGKDLPVVHARHVFVVVVSLGHRGARSRISSQTGRRQPPQGCPGRRAAPPRRAGRDRFVVMPRGIAHGRVRRVAHGRVSRLRGSLLLGGRTFSTGRPQTGCSGNRVGMRADAAASSTGRPVVPRQVIRCSPSP